MLKLNRRLILFFLLLTFPLSAVPAQVDYGKKPSRKPTSSGRKPNPARPSTRPSKPTPLNCLEQDVTPGATLTGPNGIKFVEIPGGTFCMGSTTGEDDEKPVHQVTLSGFEIGKYEVTQAQWEAVTGNNPSYFKNCPNCPVEQVSWDDVKGFITMLNAEGDGYRYRLPTEAEWEYACRAGTVDEYAGVLDAMGWYTSNSGSKTHPVGEKRPNAFGLHDMHGNVWEWCQDGYGAYSSKSVTNPTGPSSRSYRVNRGGSWGDTAALCRSAYRISGSPGNRYYYLGFRLVRIRK